MHVEHLLHLLHHAQLDLARAFREVGEGHRDETDVFHLTHKLARQCDAHAERLEPFRERYRQGGTQGPDRLHAEMFSGTRGGALGLLRDLLDLYVMAARCDMAWTLTGQAAKGLRDDELLQVVDDCEGETALALKWLRTRMKAAAPQALLVA